CPYRPSYVVPAEWRYEVVEAVAYRAERGLVVSAVNRDGAGPAPDHSRRLGERPHLAAAEQPDQSGLVISRQAPITGMRPGRRLRQPEQVMDRPAERLGLPAPLGKEAATVLDSLLPPIVWDQTRAAGFKMLEGATKAM